MLHYYEDGDKDDDDMMIMGMEVFLRKMQKGQESGHLGNVPFFIFREVSRGSLNPHQTLVPF